METFIEVNINWSKKALLGNLSHLQASPGDVLINPKMDMQKIVTLDSFGISLFCHEKYTFFGSSQSPFALFQWTQKSVPTLNMNPSMPGMLQYSTLIKHKKPCTVLVTCP